MSYILIILSLVIGILITKNLENYLGTNPSGTEFILATLFIALIVFAVSNAAIVMMESQQEYRNTRDTFCKNYSYKNNIYYCLDDGIAKPFLCEKNKCYYIQGENQNEEKSFWVL